MVSVDARESLCALRRFLAFIAVIAAMLLVLWLGARQAKAAAPIVCAMLSEQDRQVCVDCRIDALRLCKAAIVTADRATIIACMVGNRDKLRPRCARHLY